MSQNENDDRFADMELLEEYDLPLDVNPEEIRENMVVASNFFRAVYGIEKKRETLKEQKAKVLEWFAKQEAALDKNDEFVRTKIEHALYAAQANGETKPKIKTWGGTAYLTTKASLDWNGLTGESPEIIGFAEKSGLPIKVIQKVSLTDVKKAMDEHKDHGLNVTTATKTSLVIRLEKTKED